ncbi:MAG: CofH family radical SAM protein [Euryarchaeota archaeon]|jgi:aminodeoxyfutalosine synthase|nr:CofH family radical SAM protein [Euryarchaeota archaeon]
MSRQSVTTWTTTREEAGQINQRGGIPTISLNAHGMDDTVKQILEKVLQGCRITTSEGEVLFNQCDLPTLGAVAQHLKARRFGDNIFYNRNLHINQTNICVLSCRFCAFRRGRKSSDAYSLSIEEYISRIIPFEHYISEVHTVGGLHPDWGLDYYEELFKAVKHRFPNLFIKALSAVEIKHLSQLTGLSIETVLSKLNEAGLDTLPGGGAEILVDEVRDKICKGKESSQEYLDIHKEAHLQGIPTNCTMLFGTVESVSQRLTHLDKLRKLQDETKGFQCFVPYPFLPDSSRLLEAQLATSNEILRMIAISRIMLDNIPHIKAYRMNLGDNIASLALLHGADDIDGTVSHEEIMHLAGSNAPLEDRDTNLITLIESIGGVAVERNTDYTQFNNQRTNRPSRRKGLPVAHS